MQPGLKTITSRLHYLSQKFLLTVYTSLELVFLLLAPGSVLTAITYLAMAYELLLHLMVLGLYKQKLYSSHPFLPNGCFPESTPGRSQSSSSASSQNFQIKRVLGTDFYNEIHYFYKVVFHKL